MTSSFQTLFKKYRLRAEFSTLSQLGLALAEKGLMYEDSIFSHWQKGTRIPNRPTMLRFVEIFIERGVITSIDQANEFLYQAGQGYLSDKELEKLPIKLDNSTFQVPSRVINFSCREDVISKLRREKIIGKVVLIHGVAGVGKTALAIELGHILKNRFKDGVLWYKIEEDNISDILLSIAHTFGEDISNISDKQVRATVVRSLLAIKNTLLILDSGELNDDISLLIPNSRVCTTIITSQRNILKASINYIDVHLHPFTDNEVIILFKEVLKEKYPKRNSNEILKLAKQVGNLPLALHILARELQNSTIPINQLQTLLSQEKPIFQNLYYENKNLYTAIAMSYKKIDSLTKSVLVSASIFKGKDFSLKSIAYINGLSASMTLRVLQNLVDLSLIEHSTGSRYRIHPSIREFVRDKLDYPRSSYLILIAISIFAFYSIWWIFLQLFIVRQNIMYQIFSATYGLLALYGGICGIHTSLKWGGMSTLLGRSILMFSFGLLAQEFGQIVYSLYTNIKHITVPYPSLGDIGYFGTIPLYTYGVILLARSSGIKINIQSFKKKIIAVIIPLSILIISYALFLHDYEFKFENPVKIFLDFGYPLGEAMYISIALITFIFSRTVLDGILKSKALLVLAALVVQFIADYVFLYNSNSFYSGSFIDFIYLISYFVMTIALLSLRSLQVKIRNIPF